ncbi:hypothetical protein IFM89_021338 [Coptis chinensis]|uniref:Uncharacterized protein n=1 Tax=Coptis chinensis TaxID=261450 RepID=A0A835HXK2_9MAGN|nr:hypothetical protein IFM89_021338 [Coptis chinensis]
MVAFHCLVDSCQQLVQNHLSLGGGRVAVTHSTPHKGDNGKGASALVSRHSLGSTRKVNGNAAPKDGNANAAKQMDENTKPIPSKITEESNVDIAVQS